VGLRARFRVARESRATMNTPGAQRPRCRRCRSRCGQRLHGCWSVSGDDSATNGCAEPEQHRSTQPDSCPAHDLGCHADGDCNHTAADGHCLTSRPHWPGRAAPQASLRFALGAHSRRGCAYSIAAWSPDSKLVLVSDGGRHAAMTVGSVMGLPTKEHIARYMPVNGAGSWPGRGDVSWQPVFR